MRPTPAQRKVLDTLRFYVVHRYPHRRRPDETVTSVYPDKEAKKAYVFDEAVGVLWILSQRWLDLPGRRGDARPEWAMVPRAHEADPPADRDPYSFTVWDLEAFGVLDPKYVPFAGCRTDDYEPPEAEAEEPDDDID